MIKRRKNNTRCKPLPPSKRLRLEAQRVLKERVQDIADKKGIKLRFCNLKECENHIQSLDSPCESIRMEIGWPPGVPFVHPHDLPNKAKLGFLEAYEPGWTASQQDMELSLIESGQASQQSANCNSLIISFMHVCHLQLHHSFTPNVFKIYICTSKVVPFQKKLAKKIFEGFFGVHLTDTQWIFYGLFKLNTETYCRVLHA